MSAARVDALIPAAGYSVRFGGTTLKQYAHLMGQPVIAHSIEAVMRHPAVVSVTVALAPDDGIYDELVAPMYPRVHTATGGESRARTVLNGLHSILRRDPASEWVLVHDAARPCLSIDALRRLLKLGLATDHGAILAVPVSDTLKRANDQGRIESTVDRSRFWAAQTPQLFRTRELADSLEEALAAGEAPTDDAAAVERAGAHPLLVEGPRSNIKITGPEDLALAEFILQRQSMDE
ncbi:MAG TPA: 2-C-methyl-D-erythritol 4-phosphate cytidylyltransferase [Xanthomonadales bacterium]|nr:2-C-methyl-D-erythritol 4-phosphate cytidylyltransferase [Xanthomonadales bacterium]